MMDYDAMRSELAALESMAPYAQPQNPFSPINRGMQNEATSHNSKVWEEDQKRKQANVEGRKRYLRQMLAGQQSDPHGAGVRSLIGGKSPFGGPTSHPATNAIIRGLPAGTFPQSSFKGSR